MLWSLILYDFSLNRVPFFTLFSFVSLLQSINMNLFKFSSDSFSHIAHSRKWPSLGVLALLVILFVVQVK